MIGLISALALVAVPITSLIKYIVHDVKEKKEEQSQSVLIITVGNEEVVIDGKASTSVQKIEETLTSQLLEKQHGRDEES